MPDDLKDRIGKVKVPNHVRWDLKQMSAIFKDTILIHIELYDYAKQAVHVCACPDFDRLQPGEKVPEYVAELLSENYGQVITRVKWIKYA